MKYYVSQFRKTGLSDDEVIELCIEQSQKSDKPIIVFDEKLYEISRAILLPSDTTVLLDGCRIKQADYTVDNVFRGNNVICDPNDRLSVPISCEPISNIRIIGLNGAVVSGPDRNKTGYHPVLKENQEMVGDFWGWRTITVSLSNCSNFEVSGIRFEKSRCWTLSFDMCSNGYIHSLEIYTDVKNGDGIDIRSGCHNICIEDICGNTSDDSIACTALRTAEDDNKYPQGNYLYPLEPSCCIKNKNGDNVNISNVIIKNIVTGGKCHGVICLAANGCQLENIMIDGVKETEGEWREATVKIYTGYGESSSESDMKNIVVKNVESVYADYGVYCNTPIKHCLLKDIYSKNAGREIKLDYPDGFSVSYTKDSSIL